MAKSRTIQDCERDVKGIHDWQEICQEEGQMTNYTFYTLWCHSCGAIGKLSSKGRGGKRLTPQTHRHKIEVTARVKE